MKKHYIYGTHAVLGVLSGGGRQVFELLATSNAKAKLPPKAGAFARLSSDYEIMKLLEKAYGSGKEFNHQGLLAVCGGLPARSLKDVNLRGAGSLGIILDGVTDVANIGNIIRTGACFDADFLLYHKANMPEVENNDVVAKAASGGLELLPILAESNLKNAIDTLKKNGYWIVGLTGEAKQNLKDFAAKNRDLSKVCIVLGSEGKGMRDLTAKSCDFLVRIDISARMESLNVVNAAAIALYELGFIKG